MKKLLITLMVFSCMTTFTNVFGQTRFGIKVGGQGSLVSNIHLDSKPRIPGLVAGITTHIPLQSTDDPSIFLNIEALYSQEGEKIDKYTFKHDYINVPILFRYHFPSVNNQVYFELGPQFGYRISGTDESKTEFGDVKKFNAYASGGIGVCFGSEHQFEIGGRINYGLLDMYPNYPPATADFSKTSRGVNATLSVTYLFGGSKKKTYSKYNYKAQTETAEPEPYIEPEPEPKVIITEIEEKPIEEEVKIGELKPEIKEIKEDSIIGAIYFGETFTKINSKHIPGIDKIIRFMKENPQYRILMVGYSDKDTGNARNNMKFSKQRALATYTYIIQHYDIDPKRLTIDWKGDLVQPYDKSEYIKNRCVIFYTKNKLDF